MSWLDRVRNALPFTAKRDTADNLWHKCRQCQQMVFVKEWEDNLNVCPRCDHHDRIGAKERFAQLFDGGIHELIASPPAPEDPLKFRDTKKYVDRIKAARAQTGDRDAYQNAFGRISGRGQAQHAERKGGAASDRAVGEFLRVRWRKLVLQDGTRDRADGRRQFFGHGGSAISPTVSVMSSIRSTGCAASMASSASRCR